ncbi:MAG: cytochrome c [Bryobacteraceae bacterium]
MSFSKLKKASKIGLPACAFALLYAHDVITTKVTWSREISRLAYARCVSCHRDGGSAFSLTTYAEARPWAKAIKEEVNERRMPPWGAVKGFGEFRDDQGLTQEQIELINDWVEGGAPEGDPARLPKLPDFDRKDPTPKTGTELVVDGQRTLRTSLTLEGIRPNGVPEGTSLQVLAELPDGSIEPLLWLYNYKAHFQHAYYYRKPLVFPAGTKVEITPVSAGTVALLPVVAE